MSGMFFSGHGVELSRVSVVDVNWALLTQWNDILTKLHLKESFLPVCGVKQKQYMVHRAWL